MANTVGYRGQDCPIDIAGTFLKRVQSVDFGRDIPSTNVQEMGRTTPIGIVQDVKTYTCRLVVNTIESAELEDILAGTSDPTLTDYQSAAGVTIKGPYGGIAGAKVMSIEYTAVAGTGAAQTTVELEGTSWTSGSVVTPALDASAPAYVGADVEVTIGGSSVLRAQRVTVRGTLNRVRADELNNADPVGYSYDPPAATVEIEILHSDVGAQPTLWHPDVASPVEIVVVIDGGTKTITLGDCVSTGQPTSGSVRGWATQRYAYMELYGSLALS